ncbi:MAG: pknH 3 [Gemmataceae bacterium]|nr:pknH 3 [Gemmataceae bacterium]
MVTSDLGACEWFVWDLRRSGLIDRGPLDAIVGEFLKRNPRAEAPALAEYLVDQGTLTVFQAERILNGKSQGLVLGPFVLLDAIGQGSMGQVYRASSKNDANLYAIKVLPRRSMWNVRLARRQTRSFANFTHPAVVPFMDVGTAGGLHYLVWPLIEGTTLEGLVQQTGKLSPQLAALYTVQVAQGLMVAHQNNLFHGLLKPSNIMVGPDNQARILDFGIGCLLVENEGESLVDTMSTANTLTSGLDCASPESIMEPTNRTPAGDQYSLGCVLYYCLTGRVPFPEGSAVEKMMAHQSKDPMDIQELAPDVPDGLVAVVKRLMGKVPEERYTGCDELVEALEPFLGDMNTIPGGLPQAGSGRVAIAGLNRTNGTGTGFKSGPKMPGLPTRVGVGGQQQGARTNPAAPPGSHPGVKTQNPPVSHPGVKINPPPGSHPGTKANPAARTPPPARGPNLPSRASFQLPPIAEEIDTGAVATATPLDTPKPAARVATRGELAGWADDEPAERRGAGFGTIGLIAAAVMIMVAVYFGATFLLK